MTVVDNRVVVGLGGTAPNAAVVEVAARLAAVTDRTLVVVTVWSVADHLPLERGTEEETRLARAQRLLRAAVQDLPAALEVETHAVCAAAGPTLVQMAGLPGDLLVLGASRRHRLGHVSGGSVTRYCLSHARCPVLTLPEAEPNHRPSRVVAAIGSPALSVPAGSTVLVQASEGARAAYQGSKR